MEQNYYKYENEIGFALEDVKTALKSILETYKTRFIHEEKDLDDTFGTYRFGEIKCSYMVTLTKASDNSTKLSLTCSPREGSFKPSMASLEGYTKEFLNILSAKLKGTPDEEMSNVVKNNNSDSSLSTISVIITIIAIAIMLAILFM